MGTMATKPLYKGFSIFEFIWTLFLRLVGVIGLVYSLAHYEENPVVVLIVSGLLLLFIFVTGDDQIIIYEDRITQTTNSFGSLIFQSKGNTIDIATIKHAYLEPYVKPGISETGAAAVLAFLVPGSRVNRGKTKSIFFELKNGEAVTFETNLESAKRKSIVEIVNSLVR